MATKGKGTKRKGEAEEEEVKKSAKSEENGDEGDEGSAKLENDVQSILEDISNSSDETWKKGFLRLELFLDKGKDHVEPFAEEIVEHLSSIKDDEEPNNAEKSKKAEEILDKFFGDDGEDAPADGDLGDDAGGDGGASPAVEEGGDKADDGGDGGDGGDDDE